jgi:polyphenol oxidase
VLENRERLAAALGVDLGSFVVARQVHGARVAMVSAADRGLGARGDADAVPDADALVTNHRDVVLAVMVADCVPVIVFDPVTPAVAVVHAGRKGTAAHIAREAVETMTASFDSDPVHFVAALGPSIGPDSYEVDLWASNVADLVAAGLRRENVEVAGIDTFADERFFSHRLGQPTGRFMAFAALGTGVAE